MNNGSTQNNQPPARVVTRDLLNRALQQPRPTFLPQMFPADFQTHISFSHPPSGDDFHSPLPAHTKKYLLSPVPSLLTSSDTSRTCMKSVNSHFPSTLFRAVSMFITFPLNHPSRTVKSPNCSPIPYTQVIFSLSDHHLRSL